MHKNRKKYRALRAGLPPGAPRSRPLRVPARKTPGEPPAVRGPGAGGFSFGENVVQWGKGALCEARDASGGVLPLDANERLALRRKDAVRRRILLAVQIAFGVLFAAGFIGLAVTMWGYHKGEQSYADLRELVRVPAAGSTAQPGGDAPEEAAPAIDFDALRAMYPDTIAWLTCPGTAIDYPVMHAADNDYYLRRLPSGEWNMGGSLFLDYRHSADFTGAVNVIYGHNMNDGSMFGELEQYGSQAYYMEHPAMTLETADKTYTLHAVYGFVISAEEWVQRDFVNTANRDALLEYASQRSTFKSDYAPAQNAPLAALVTCTSADDQNRYILVCALETA